jgi:hypothetical protein
MPSSSSRSVAESMSNSQTLVVFLPLLLLVLAAEMTTVKRSVMSFLDDSERSRPLLDGDGGLAFPVSSAEMSSRAMTEVFAELGDDGLSGKMCRHLLALSTTKRLDEREPDQEA